MSKAPSEVHSKQYWKNRAPNIVISDTHSGCKLGLYPKEPVKLDQGGYYVQSRLQEVLWSWWEEFWGEWVPLATKGEPYCIVHNAELTDGVHHNSTTQISQCLKDQAAIAQAIMLPIVAKAEYGYYQIRGTPAHSGQSSIEEERIAKELKAVKSRDGQSARFELWKKLGDHLIHYNHHIGTTSSSAHEASAVNAEVTAMLVEAARWGESPASVIVRSHRHRSIEVRLPTDRGFLTGVVTPAWQLKTPFAFRVAGARQAPPQIGGVCIKLDSEGQPFTQTFVRNIERDEPE